MSSARFLVGDVFDRMAELPDHSVDLIVTSPPFLALRSYLPADHPDKGKEIGSEPTPAAFLTTLLALTREWRRILTPTGSLCVELGDTYSGSGARSGEDGPTERQTEMLSTHVDRDGEDKYEGNRLQDRRRAAHNGNRNRDNAPGWPLDKSLCLIPSLFAGSLAYGRNLLNPDDELEPWRVRNLIVWHRPNPPVGALGDKVRPSTSYVTVACTAKDRWFDLDSERTPGNSFDRPQGGPNGSKKRGPDIATHDRGLGDNERILEHNPAGAPPLDCWFEDRLAQSDEPIDVSDADVWTIPTAPYAGAHYATFPPALPRRLINLMCPRQVCTSCGEPRRRITRADDEAIEYNRARRRGRFELDLDRAPNGSRMPTGWGPSGPSGGDGGAAGFQPSNPITVGWTNCECLSPQRDGTETALIADPHKWRRGIVCDPFAGSGTTLQAASELGRDSIGIDLDRRNLELARQRLGMFLVEDEVPA